MDRRTLLGFAVAVALPGCAGLRGDPPIAERFDCDEAKRPGPDDAYPDAPEEFDENTVSEFVKNHEGAYRRRGIEAQVEEPIDSIQLFFDPVAVRGRRGDAYVVRVDLMVGYSTTGDDESHSSVGHAPRAAVYAVDESGAVRVAADHTAPRSESDPRPDPLEDGDLVTCF